MNLFTDIRALVVESLESLQSAGELPATLEFENVSVEPPRDAAHGDMATNAAMVLAKPAGLKPARHCRGSGGRPDRGSAYRTRRGGRAGISESPAGAGSLAGVVGRGLCEGASYGRSDMGRGSGSMSNSFRPIPPGPCMSATPAVRFSATRWRHLLDFAGHEVTREYYINDGGAQVDVLARSVYLRYREAADRSPAFADGTYPGDYLMPVGARR